MNLAVRIVRTARSVRLAFGRGCRALAAYKKVYKRLAYEQVVKESRSNKADGVIAMDQHVLKTAPPTRHKITPNIGAK